MPRPRENGELRTRYRKRSQGTQRNDPACVAWSTKHRAWDMTSTQAFTTTPDYPRLLSLLLFFCFSFPDHICLSCRLGPCHMFFLQNHIPLLTLREHYFINPLCIFCSNTWIFSRRIFVAKAEWQCNLVKVLGQQPRFQCMLSSVTM